MSYALGDRNELFGGHPVDVEVGEQLLVTDVYLVG